MNDLINRQDAIDAINKIAPVDTEYDCKLLDRIDVRYVLIELPSAQPEIVRCKDCKHWKGNDEPIAWNDGNVFVEVPCETMPTDFCSAGKRKEK